MEPYPSELREYVVERMLGPQRVGINAMAREMGIGSTTLSRWRDQARSVAGMSKKSTRREPRSSASRRPQDWSSQERLDAVIEAAGLDEAALGVWLREHGLHAADLEQWREAAVRGLCGRSAGSRDARQVKDLRRELARKEKALAEAAALLVLSGKARALWGEEGESTTKR
jgi:transposase-like protein